MAENRELMDLHNTLNDALFITSNKIMKSAVTVMNQVPRLTHFITGCANQMEQVFVNLIGNACDALTGLPERRLTLAVSEVRRENVDYWKCDVIDTGPGVPAGLREEIFRSFFTTKEKGKGTGLGLSISRGIVTEHKGFIELTSGEGKGSTFSVFLPQTPAPKSDG
jgi:signal transduction histidine kinase